MPTPIPRASFAFGQFRLNDPISGTYRVPSSRAGSKARRENSDHWNTDSTRNMQRTGALRNKNFASGDIFYKTFEVGLSHEIEIDRAAVA